MTSEEMNAVPEKIKHGAVSGEDAVWQLLTEVYVHPGRFLNTFVDGDTKSDFIINIQPKIKTIIDHYKAGICPFSAYFTLYISHAFCSWRRRLISEAAAQKVLMANTLQMYEEQCEKYDKDEYYHLNDASEKRAIKKKNSSLPSLCRSRSINTLDKWQNKNFMQKKITILALKSCYYIHDKQIPSLSKACGCDQNSLQNSINTLRTGLSQKAEQRENFIQHRDNAYFFHKKYAIEMQSVLPDTPAGKKLLKKYLRHTKSWKLKNKILQTNRCRVCPSNKTIAGMLGISERQVSYYIAAVKYNCTTLTSIVKHSAKQGI